MIEVNVCPSTLQQGFDTYSPAARKQLFDGKEVSFILDFDSPNNDSADNESYLKNVGRISLSGVQPKASLVLDSEGRLIKPAEGEHGTYIFKPAPTSYALLDRKYCPANEHLTMQLASQVYRIETAAKKHIFISSVQSEFAEERKKTSGRIYPSGCPLFALFRAVPFRGIASTGYVCTRYIPRTSSPIRGVSFVGWGTFWLSGCRR